MFRFSVCVLAVVLAVTVVAAYDFSDSDFNALLLDQYQVDYDEDLEALSRSRRDAEMPPSGPGGPKECGRRDMKKDFHCCKGEKFDQKQIDAFKEAKKQCFIEIRGEHAEDMYDPFNCEKMQEIREQMVCVSECVSRKFATIDEHGELQRDAILTLMRAKIGDSKWKIDAVESYVDKCLAEVKAKQAVQKTTATVGTAQKTCNDASMDFHHCIWREFANGCPADQRVDTPKCDKMRERLAKGDTSFLNKHFLHHFHHKPPPPQ